MQEIVELLDKADELIRKQMEEHLYGSLSQRYALREARGKLQEAITILLDAK